MPILRSLVSTALDAVFPVPQCEAEVLWLSPEQAWHSLPRAEQFPIPEACSVFAYKDEHVWRLIWGIKYKKSRMAAATAAYALYQILSVYALCSSPVIVVPMPITAKRRRERGYNQCELILAEMEKLNKDNRLRMESGLLRRSRHKSRQTLKDREERLESARDIFTLNEQPAGTRTASNSFVVVIDDVITTGSTMRDAVQTMRRGGYANTFGLSVAH